MAQHGSSWRVRWGTNCERQHECVVGVSASVFIRFDAALVSTCPPRVIRYVRRLEFGM